MDKDRGVITYVIASLIVGVMLGASIYLLALLFFWVFTGIAIVPPIIYRASIASIILGSGYAFLDCLANRM
jgi:hypothetical protein